MPSPICLPNTSLCAIVRDEIMNPAGGIRDFIESTVPFVEQAVIVDTGSLDGTREALDEARRRYPTLAVHDHPFRDYASARNFSLEQVTTRYALVLDADERLTRDDFGQLQALQERRPADGYNFRRIAVYPTEIREQRDNHDPRLFVTDRGFRYRNLRGKFGEILRSRSGWMSLRVTMHPLLQVVDTGIIIKHFFASPEGRKRKADDWYFDAGVWKGDKQGIVPAPSTVPSFQEWRRYNPRREEYR